MPTYMFVCPKDGTKEEAKLTIAEYSALELYTCPECGDAMIRKFSPPAIQIK